MAKTITIEYKNKKYTLGYTRASIVMMEKNGFNVADMSDHPLSAIPELFAGAFIAHHNKVDAKLIDEIYDHLTNKEELISCLAEMYAEPIQSLMGEPEKGKVEWEKNW